MTWHQSIPKNSDNQCVLKRERVRQRDRETNKKSKPASGKQKITVVEQ